jgi:hypothetical protein
MAIVSVQETLNNRNSSARVRDTVSYGRSWAVKVDNPGEPLLNISNAVPVQFGDYHPEDTSVIASQVDIRASGDVLLFEVNWTYEVPGAIDSIDAGETQPPPSNDPSDPGGGRPVTSIPADVWSGTTSLAAVPVTKDLAGNPIVNSANVPIPDQAAMRPFGKLELTRSYESLAQLTAEISAYTGTVNAGAWAGTGPRTWLCEGCRWSKQSQTMGKTLLVFYQATWSFSFDAREWILEPIDRGYMEKDGSGGLKNIMVNGEPASDPVPLNNGVAAPGTTPNILTYYIYPAVDFSYWGNPG